MTPLAQWTVVLLLVAFAVAGNLLLKVGAARIDLANLPAGALNLPVAAGLALFAFAAACYVLLLRFLPLNAAQAFMALQFAATVTAAALVLGEVMSGLRIAGLAIILIGIVIVSFTR